VQNVLDPGKNCTYHRGMKTPDAVLAKFGAKAIAAAIGQSERTVLRYAGRKHLPAMWFDAIERLYGAPVPRDVFNFKRAK